MNLNDYPWPERAQLEQDDYWSRRARRARRARFADRALVWGGGFLLAAAVAWGLLGWAGWLA